VSISSPEDAEDATETCMTPSMLQVSKMPEDTRHQIVAPSRLRQEGMKDGRFNV